MGRSSLVLAFASSARCEDQSSCNIKSDVDCAVTCVDAECAVTCGPADSVATVCPDDRLVWSNC